MNIIDTFNYIRNEIYVIFMYIYKGLIDSWPYFRNWEYTTITPLIFKKEGSLPYQTRALFDEEAAIKAKRGMSVFGMNLEDRERDNLYKKKYVFALDKNKVEQYYRPIIKTELTKLFDSSSPNRLKSGDRLLSNFQNMAFDLFGLLHWGRKMEKIDRTYALNFIENLRSSKVKPLYKVIYDLIKHRLTLRDVYKRFDEIIKTAEKNSMIDFWKESKLNEGASITVELLHNYLAIPMQYTHTVKLIAKLFIDNKIKIEDIPNDDQIYDQNGFSKLDKFVFEVYRMITPNRVIVSAIEYLQSESIRNFTGRENIGAHDLETINYSEKYWNHPEKFDCSRFDTAETTQKNIQINDYSPNELEKKFYSTKKLTVCPVNNNLVENQGYAPFGIGYRRCAGEFLNYAFAKEFLLIVKKNNLKFKIDEAIKDNIIISPNIPNLDNILML